jgi:NadR type nicotinamide-nucleotide adenylyltransferase
MAPPAPRGERPGTKHRLGVKYRHALVLGKFYPPHAGHHHLIRTAATLSDRTTVVVLAADVESISLEDRVRWLRTEHATEPGVAVLGDIDNHPTDLTDDTIWRAHVDITRAVLARRATADGDPTSAPVDAVFTSEDYGTELAARLGAQHICVDLDRTTHQVSGTAVRADPAATWHHLAPATRAGLAARVVVLGAESTGTTTLATALAAHYRSRGGAYTGTALVPEYGRTHTEHKLAAATALAAAAGESPPDVTDLIWTVGDFLDVATQQAVAEDIAAATGGPILVCDNDSWAATVWAIRYLGAPQPLVAQAVTRTPHLYLLTDHVGVPFEQDGWRDGEHLRAWMTALFVRELTARGVPWLLLTGSPGHRLRRAIRACDHLLTSHLRYADPLG